MQNDLQYIKEDLNAVERHRIELYRARDRCSVKLKMLSDSPMGMRSHTSTDRSFSGLACNSCTAQGGVALNSQYKKDEGKVQLNPIATLSKDSSFSGPTSQHVNQSGLSVTRKKRVHAQVRQVAGLCLEQKLPHN